MKSKRQYNGVYEKDHLNRIAFPLGGIGAGMLCIEGTGALSHCSLRNSFEFFHEPCIFSAIFIKGKRSAAKVLEGPVPSWKVFGSSNSAYGRGENTYGLPRFAANTFETRFPFATLTLKDKKIPLDIRINAWSPFTPPDADNSSLPVAALEYTFSNPNQATIEATYSFNSANFIKIAGSGNTVLPARNGFIFWQPGTKEKPWNQGAFCACVDSPDAIIDHAWFRGSWFDSLSMVWNEIEKNKCSARPPIREGERSSPGASIMVPLRLEPGQERTIRLMFSWHVPFSNQRIGDFRPDAQSCSTGCSCDQDKQTTPDASSYYRPWYASRFSDIKAMAGYWRDHYDELREKSKRFSDCFYDTTLPPEVTEAIAANLTILKATTVFRQHDGRLWCWEGLRDSAGCCHGSCTHVWNYAQAIAHLFPSLERTLRQTEFHECQDERGHQTFRAALPIQTVTHGFHSAADGQLGGIMKVYRDWRVSGDSAWLKSIWPKVKQSLNYCIETWDPGHKGTVEEPHHNTYDIEFWGPDGMCTSFYHGALQAACLMAKALDDEQPLFEELLEKSRVYLESKLFNGEYFYQEVKWQELRAKNPVESLPKDEQQLEELVKLVSKEGPKYQYGKGCLSDGVLGLWMSEVCGSGNSVDPAKVKSHLHAVYRHNLKKNLATHANPQRPTFAMGNEGGLLLCTWPRGKRPSLPFVYSDEVWTGIEYQVAAHLMLTGQVEKGLEIVRTCRDRYDGRIRNPFDEYECGHWYARAMSSYALIQGLTGLRYDAVDKTLHLKPGIPGDFRAFLACATGFGTAGIRDGKPFIEVKEGSIEVKQMTVNQA